MVVRRMAASLVQTKSSSFQKPEIDYVYGPKDNGRKFIANAVRSIQNNKPIELYGDGLDLRDFIYSEDLGSVSAAIKPTTGFSINAHLEKVLQCLI